jgi:hypothetical protein
MAGSYCDGYAARQERVWLAPAGLRVQAGLDKPQLVVGLAADLGEHIRRFRRDFTDTNHARGVGKVDDLSPADSPNQDRPCDETPAPPAGVSLRSKKHCLI